MMKEFTVRTGSRAEMRDITSQVEKAASEIGCADGAILIFVPHTTAGLTINENADPSVVTDMLMGLERIAPENAGYRHAEGNSDAHIKSTLTGCSLMVSISNGRLDLGTWQSVYFCEFDGPRTRKVWIRTL